MSIIHVLETAHPMTKGKIPELWCQPKDAGKLTLNSGNISNLGNKSAGSWNDLAESTGSLQPLFTSNGVNGLGSMHIKRGTTGKGLRSNNSSNLPPGTNTFVQFVFEYLEKGTTDRNELYSIRYGGSGFALLFLRLDSDSRLRAAVFDGLFSLVDNIVTASPIVIGTKFIVTHYYDTVRNVHDLRLNGVSQGTTTAARNPTPTVLNFLYGTSGNIPDSSITGFFSDFAYETVTPELHIIERRERFFANEYNITI